VIATTADHSGSGGSDTWSARLSRSPLGVVCDGYRVIFLCDQALSAEMVAWPGGGGSG
jgi:hypothetical protein